MKINSTEKAEMINFLDAKAEKYSNVWIFESGFCNSLYIMENSLGSFYGCESVEDFGDLTSHDINSFESLKKLVGRFQSL